jgi:phytoene dehydrogenase-like protein
MLPTLTDALPKDYAESVSRLEKVLSLTLWLGLDKQYFPLKGSEIWIETDPPCWVVPTSNYDETLAPKGHQVVGFTTNISADADIESEKSRLLSAITSHMEGIEEHITMQHWQALVPEKAAWVINQEMPSQKSPIDGLYLVGTDTTNKSMGVTRASYSVLALRDALRDDGVL